LDALLALDTLDTLTMWHFAEVDEQGIPRLRFNDNRAIRVGETLTVDVAPVVCQAGLHACPHLLDALNYAPKHCALTAVILSGTVMQGTGVNADKYSATQRTVTALLSVPATDALLREFARWCALSVAHLWDMPDIVRVYLETGDELLRDAAGDAVWDAAGTARDAARDAARNAQNAWLEHIARVSMHDSIGRGRGDSSAT